MKKILATVTIAGLVLLVGGTALAQDKAKYGYVDVRKVMLESKVGKQNKAVIEKMIAERKTKLEKEEAELKALQQEYEKNQLILTEDKKKEKQKQFQEKLQAFKRDQAQAQEEVGRKDAEFSQKALAEIRTIIAEIAKQEKLSLVFEKNQMPVLYAEDGPDITQKVTQRYDAKHAK